MGAPTGFAALDPDQSLYTSPAPGPAYDLNTDSYGPTLPEDVRALLDVAGAVYHIGRVPGWTDWIVSVRCPRLAFGLSFQLPLEAPFAEFQRMLGAMLDTGDALPKPAPPVVPPLPLTTYSAAQRTQAIIRNAGLFNPQGQVAVNLPPRYTQQLNAAVPYPQVAVKFTQPQPPAPLPVAERLAKALGVNLPKRLRSE